MKCKRFVVWFYCFFSSEICHWSTTEGSEGDAHLNLCDHLFSCLHSLGVFLHTLDKVYSLLPHPKHFGDLVWLCAFTICKRVVNYARLVAQVVTSKRYVTSHAVTILKLLHDSTLYKRFHHGHAWLISIASIFIHQLDK